jgi:hypothetical protein
MEIRDIIRVVASLPLLAPYQVALILEISMKYLIPIHRVLGFFLSKTVIKRLKKKDFEQLDSQPSSYRTISPSNHITILKDSIITGVILEKYLGPGTVILCPDDFTLYRLQRDL